MKILKFEPVFVEFIPKELEQGKIYITKKYNVAVHLCACGCGIQTVTPLGIDEWTLIENDNKVTLTPSIGNFSGEEPYHAHYFITDNKVIFV